MLCWDSETRRGRVSNFFAIKASESEHMNAYHMSEQTRKHGVCYKQKLLDCQTTEAVVVGISTLDQEERSPMKVRQTKANQEPEDSSNSKHALVKLEVVRFMRKKTMLA